ncbi:hypothetical protein M2105_005383 [Paenibacillus sp. PastF-1]|nr:hypothetical protein [Paenibacillus sp. PastF-2]MDF9857502.1 hypothetical protein [Paenibacillus sp. PastF-1]MDH6482722.1 hypothetical protein [Paenibacillus sp. PastH-2]MDH6510148.1 hypothetical protein [Paenibacillus sp. PastM-3]
MLNKVKAIRYGSPYRYGFCSGIRYIESLFVDYRYFNVENKAEGLDSSIMLYS